MAKFNVGGRAPTTSPITTTGTTPDTKTHEDGPGYARDDRSALFLLAVSNLVGENTFYEGSTERDERYRSLVAKVAVSNPIWLYEMLRWLRQHGNMRSASIVGAAEAAHALLAARKRNDNDWYRLDTELTTRWPETKYGNGRGLIRTLIDVVCQRADEPGEMIAYWRSRYGKSMPQPVKRGLADAAARLYTEYATLKYDTATRGGGGGFRFGDVVELVHPKPSSYEEAPHQGHLFRHILDRRHARLIEWDELDGKLPMLQANALLRERIKHGDTSARRELLDSGHLRDAGMTWEDVLSLSGSLNLPKNRVWEALIPTMGYMALLRNLRNFDEAGVSDASAETVARRLSNTAQVKRSRQFPFRFWSAYKNAPSVRWSLALDRAMTASIVNIPVLYGRTLVLVDTSGSMIGMNYSQRSTANYAELAAIFGVALGVRASMSDRAQVDVVGFADGVFNHPIRRGASLITEVQRFVDRIGEAGGGTDIAGAAQRAYDGHDRVIIISDMQTMRSARAHARGALGLPTDALEFGGWSRTGVKITDVIPNDVPVYGFNLAGYEAAAMPSGNGTRHEIGGGLTDKSFAMIELLERGQHGQWPWADDPDDSDDGRQIVQPVPESYMSDGPWRQA